MIRTGTRVHPTTEPASFSKRTFKVLHQRPDHVELAMLYKGQQECILVVKNEVFENNWEKVT